MTYNFTDSNFINSSIYQNFLEENPVYGYLKIRAYTAGGAVPIEGLKVTVSKNIDENKIIFFEGTTNDSGVIDTIQLPAPRINGENLNAPNRTKYDITATYNNITYTYIVNIFENIYVIQNINITPSMNEGEL